MRSPSKNHNYNKETAYSFKTCEKDVVCNKHSDLEAQWRKILLRWDVLVAKEPERAHHLVLKGIPETMRGEAWRAFCGVKDLTKKNPGVYQSLGDCTRNLSVCDSIKKDIDRTFPKNKKFKLKGGKGQQSLLNVLVAYAVMDPEIGYCQGMSFLAAVLVYYMEDDDAFWGLVQIIKGPKYNLRGFYAPGLPSLRLYLYKLSRLTEIFLPDLFMHFVSRGVHPLLYASEWFSTLFSYNFPFALSVRIFDMFMLEGPDFLLQLCIAILSTYQGDLLSFGFEDMILFLKDCGQRLDDDILQKAFHFKSLRTEMREIETEVTDPKRREEKFAAYTI